MGSAHATDGNFPQNTRTIDKYQARNCTGCLLKGACHKSKGNRIIGCRIKETSTKNKAKKT